MPDPHAATGGRPPNPARLMTRVATAVRGVITGVETTEPVAALTFDDGPHALYTPRLLDLLDRHAATATFFLVGEAAERHPTLVAEIARRGHVIGNHSWSHPSFTMITGAERRRELRRCRDVLGRGTSPLFRPPYGHHSRPVRLDAAWCGMDTIGWSLDVHDWCEGEVPALVTALEAGIHPGSIVLLHDAIHDRGMPSRGPALHRAAHLDRDAMLTALDLVLARLAPRLRFVSVPELLRCGALRTRA